MSSRRAKTRHLTGRQVSILKEVKYIVGRAASHDCRVVGLGSLVLFSTESGDAWMLDPEDGLALCLARDGSAMSVNIKETDERYAIEWTGTYAIDGPTMSFTDRSGSTASIRSIVGYPTDAIQRTIQQLQR